jgi:hypothetical protein
MIFLFADEAGNFDFSLKGSRYFIVTAVTMNDWSLGASLLDLRHQLCFQTEDLREEGFHATEDKQHIRDRVFELIRPLDFKIDAVILDKRKAYKRVTENEAYFYQLAWHFLLRNVARYLPKRESLLIVAGSLGTRQRRILFKQALDSVIRQHILNSSWRLGFWKTSSHPCLQLADYCAWAVQRWKEKDDKRSLILIEQKVNKMWEPFNNSTTFYY